MEVVPFRSREDEVRPDLVRCLEEILADAKAGKIHGLIIVGVDDRTGVTHRLWHRARNTTLIGAVSCRLFELQAKWNYCDDTAT